MQINEAMQQIADLARASQISDFDILGYDSMSESVEVFEGKVSNSEIQSAAALGIRVFKNARPGIAFTERLTADALKVCLADAVSHCELTDPVNFSVAENRPAPAGNFDHRSDGFDGVGFADLTQFAIDLESKARTLDKRIENVPYTGAGRSRGTGFFLNSRGVSYQHTHEEFSAYSAAVAAAGEQKKMGFYSNSRRNFSELQQLGIAERAVERSVEQLGARPVPHGNYRVLFSNRVSGQIVSLYQSAFFALEALRGQSRLKGKLGEIIASPVFHLRSEALNTALKGARARDSEGVPTRNIDVVQNGKFVNFLYNLESAAADKVESTGNGSRSIASRTGTAFKNLVVTAGPQTREQMLSAGKILLIDKLEGAAGCSAVSGELSIGAQGFLCENGEIQHAVDRITLSSNFFDMLQNMEQLSCEYNDQYSSLRVPDMLVANIAVAG